MEGNYVVTIKDLIEDWIQARAALRQQVKKLETDLVFPQAGLAEHERRAIAARLKILISEFDALLKEHPNS